MTPSSFLYRLERKHFLSRSPHPLVPFLIALAFLLLSRIPPLLDSLSFILFITALAFAILHFIIVLLLPKTKPL